MATMDIFEADAFSVIELTRALENIPFKPALLSSSNLFSPRGVRARTVVIESRDGIQTLLINIDKRDALMSDLFLT